MKWLLTAFQLLPTVLQSILQIETSVNAPGATKKAIVLSAVHAATAVGEAVPNETVALVSSLIDATVAQLNASGVFSHGKAAATQPSAS